MSLHPWATDDVVPPRPGPGFWGTPSPCVRAATQPRARGAQAAGPWSPGPPPVAAGLGGRGVRVWWLSPRWGLTQASPVLCLAPGTPSAWTSVRVVTLSSLPLPRVHVKTAPCLPFAARTSVQHQPVPSLSHVQRWVAGHSAWLGTEFPRSGTFCFQTSQVRDELRQVGRPDSEPRETLRIRADGSGNKVTQKPADTPPPAQNRTVVLP